MEELFLLALGILIVVFSIIIIINYKKYHSKVIILAILKIFLLFLAAVATLYLAMKTLEISRIEEAANANRVIRELFAL